MTEISSSPAGTDATSAPAEATTAPQRQGRQGGRGRPPAGKPQPSQARAPRDVHPALQQLFTLYPKMFGAHFLPLKLGVFQELLALHPDTFKRDELKIALGLHARSTRYLESVASGLPRHDLNGDALEPVAPEHVHHAIMEVFRRRQARSNQDLRPYARVQLIEAIEASGLSREDYLLCIRQQDDVSMALLDDALAELAERAAKRDALLRMFDASGKSEAEFADMYGMHPDEVNQTLQRARADQAAHAAALVRTQEAREAEDSSKSREAPAAAEAPETATPEAATPVAEAEDVPQTQEESDPALPNATAAQAPDDADKNNTAA